MTEAQPVTWRVTGQVERTQIDPTGRPVQGMTVTFQTGSGTTGSVWLPLPLYTPDNVRKAIGEAASGIEAVAGLTSEG